MKRQIIIIALVLAFVPFASQCSGGGDSNHESQSTADVFASFAQHFSSATAFANATVGGREVLLVSQEVFGDSAGLEAIAASVFALDSVGGILSLGSVRSQGTNYPVSLLDGRLLVAGHQFVYVYSIRGEMPDLVLDECFQGDGPEMDPAFDTFELASPIIFKRI